MHGAGNDYIYIDATREWPVFDLHLLVRKVSDRHFGIGADGLVVLLPSLRADLRMRMFNADGSEAQMCGNASRCIALFARSRGLVHDDTFTLETNAGIKALRINRGDNGAVHSVTVDMGTASFDDSCLPAERDDNARHKLILATGDKAFTTVPVSMGNPHGVIFTDEISDELVHKYGPLLENHSRWPEKANIEFVHRISPSEFEMRVWERGSGETLACGTGACAAAAAAWLLGSTAGEIHLHLPGGILTVSRDDDGHILLTGPAAFVCDGVYYFDDSATC